jgi:hypothetical protein
MVMGAKGQQITQKSIFLKLFPKSSQLMPLIPVIVSFERSKKPINNLSMAVMYATPRGSFAQFSTNTTIGNFALQLTLLFRVLKTDAQPQCASYVVMKFGLPMLETAGLFSWNKKRLFKSLLTTNPTSPARRLEFSQLVAASSFTASGVWMVLFFLLSPLLLQANYRLTGSGMLATSRGFGDASLKPVVLATPQIFPRSKEADDLAIVSSSLLPCSKLLTFYFRFFVLMVFLTQLKTSKSAPWAQPPRMHLVVLKLLVLLRLFEPSARTLWTIQTWLMSALRSLSSSQPSNFVPPFLDFFLITFTTTISKRSIAVPSQKEAMTTLPLL